MSISNSRDKMLDCLVAIVENADPADADALCEAIEEYASRRHRTVRGLTGLGAMIFNDLVDATCAHPEAQPRDPRARKRVG